MLQAFVNWIMLSSTYTLVALGLTLAFGIMHIINFAHGAVYMVGAYALFVFMTHFSLSYFIAGPLAIVLVALLGPAIDRLVLVRMRGDILRVFLAMLGLSSLLENGMALVFGPYAKSVPRPFTSAFDLPGGVQMGWERVVVIVVGLAGVAALYLFIQRTRLGRAMRAVEQNPAAAALQGVSINGISSLCMFVGSALAALAGVIMAPVFAIEPYMGTPTLMKATVIIVLGGLGSVPGSVVGAFILGLVDSAGATYFGGPVSSIAGFALLVLILVVKPSGLFGFRATSI